MFKAAPSFLSLEELRDFIPQALLKCLVSVQDLARASNLSTHRLYKAPLGLYAKGNLALLNQPGIAIIGTRKPNQYARQLSALLASELVKRGFVILSGGALGVDSIAQASSGKNSILVSPAGLDTAYPRENQALFDRLGREGLLLSEYGEGFRPRRYSFLERNRIILALSLAVLVPQADLRSGSSASARLALALKKPLFVLPHRLGESLGTQELLSRGLARAIYDVGDFADGLCKELGLEDSMGAVEAMEGAGLLEFASQNGLFAEALEKFGSQVFEYELEGKIRRNGIYIQLN